MVLGQLRACLQADRAPTRSEQELDVYVAYCRLASATDQRNTQTRNPYGNNNNTIPSYYSSSKYL